MTFSLQPLAISFIKRMILLFIGLSKTVAQKFGKQGVVPVASMCVLSQKQLAFQKPFRFLDMTRVASQGMPQIIIKAFGYRRLEHKLLQFRRLPQKDAVQKQIMHLGFKRTESCGWAHETRFAPVNAGNIALHGR
ncbi:hypothetical protein [Cohnella zeiphila]|uniref:Uncharacterized protein n=1 Tax=Cohnella zeiphila TaxID=2761120 RepID=A0A7X0W0A1_9BACL|nr:hypothetical protein [Cohnella zeiphila]MBB6734843.1 hypothetical protein [Cohnella zeiphila]